MYVVRETEIKRYCEEPKSVKQNSTRREIQRHTQIFSFCFSCCAKIREINRDSEDTTQLFFDLVFFFASQRELKRTRIGTDTFRIHFFLAFLLKNSCNSEITERN